MAALVAGGFFAHRVFAGPEHNVSGWAWSENIGWVSFNSSDSGAGGGADYGVNIDESTGVMSGYAWSENIGWISFNAADLASCPSGACEAKVDTACAGGNCEVSGWARVLANGGGWTGFVSLRGADYGVYIDPATKDFHGWAWSDMVLGWLSFNSANPGAGGGPYKVYTTANIGLTAKMECDDASCPDGACDDLEDSIWEAWTPTGDCVNCVYKVKNLSSGNVNCTKWELVGTSYAYASSGKADHTFQPGVPAREEAYDLRLTVSDQPYNEISNPNCTAGNSSFVDHKIIIRQNVAADFKCSLSDPNIYDEDGGIVGVDDSVFENCTKSLDKSEFEKRIVKNGSFWVQDFSTPSAGAASPDLNYAWRFVINEGLSDERIENSSDAMTSFKAGKTNKVEIYVTDSLGQMNCKIVNYRARTLPKWEEVPI